MPGVPRSAINAIEPEGRVMSDGHWQLEGTAAAELFERYLVPAITAKWAEDLMDRAQPREGEAVLDIACGTGIVARLAAKRIGRGLVTGLDLNTGMLAVARSAPTEGAAITWIEGSALDLPFLADSFDVVFCQLGLQFFPDQRKALDEMCRVLKGGGRAALSVFSRIERTPGAKAFVLALDDVIQREHECLRSRRPLDPAKDAQRRASPTFENAAHLIQSLSLVWKKLQSELAEDNIKAVREEWQIESAALNPSDRSSLRRRTSGDSQHPGVQVEASHQPSTDSFRRQTRHNAGPASDVQNRFSLPRLRAVHEILCPLRGDRGHEVTLEKLRRRRAL